MENVLLEELEMNLLPGGDEVDGNDGGGDGNDGGGDDPGK